MKIFSFKNILIFVLSISFFAFFISIKLFFLDQCYTTKIFSSYKSFGYNHIKQCYSKKNLEHNIKKLSKDFPIFFEFLRKKKRNYYGSSNQDLITFSNTSYMKNSRDHLENYKYISGIINKKVYENIKLTDKESLIESSNWIRSHGGNWNTHYSNSEKINKNNINELRLIWKNQSIVNNKIKKEYKQNVQLNPIIINKKLLYATPDNKLLAVEVKTGNKIWELQSLVPPSRRGMVGFIDKKKNEYLFLPVGGKIYKINSKNGKLMFDFGDHGAIDSGTIIAPMIYKNFLVSVTLSRAIQTFDINTGKRLFSKTIHPERNFSGATPWGGVALDKANGLVFLVTGNPIPSLYGVNRVGANKNSSSVIAFNLNTQKILWTFQDVNHDLWDFDISSPPILHNLKIGDKLYEVVIALTKTGNVLLLERRTGKPIFDLRYKKAPLSDVPGEIISNYQLDLEKPEKFAKTDFNKSDYNKLPINKIKEIDKLMINSKHGWFEPPSFRKNLITFGLHGGAQWPGAAIDPFNQELFIPTNNVPWSLRLSMRSMEWNYKKFTKDREMLNLYYEKCSSCHGKSRNGIKIKSGEKLIKYVPSLVGLSGDMAKPLFGNRYIEKKFQTAHLNKFKDIDLKRMKMLFSEWDNHLYKKKLIRVDSNKDSWVQFLTSDSLPASNPPWGYIAKIDLVTGKLKWKKTIGKKLINNKWIETGSSIFGGVALNKSGILFVTGTDDNFIYAIDSKTGKDLWSYEMEASGSAPPIIYEVDGKEYLSVVSTGGTYHNYKKKDSSIYTFSVN